VCGLREPLVHIALATHVFLEKKLHVDEIRKERMQSTAAADSKLKTWPQQSGVF